MHTTSALTLSGVNGPALSEVEGFARPYVVSWNLTYRCNLACEHCYLDAGSAPLVGTENFADRMRSIPIVTTASGKCAGPGATPWRERRS